MANPYKEYALDRLMSAGEQPGSQASYYVDREMQRRRELAQQEVDAKVIAAQMLKSRQRHCQTRGRCSYRLRAGGQRHGAVDKGFRCRNCSQRCGYAIGTMISASN